MAVYTAVHGVYGPRTPACNGRVHSASTAVYRVHLHGRVLCTRPCLRPVYTAAHGCVQTVYTTVHGPRTWSLRDPITAVYAARTPPCTVKTAVFTARVHGIVRNVYTAVHGVYGSCTPACKGRVHGAPTAMYRVNLHGRVLCTRLVYGPCTRPLTAVYRLCTRPCTGHVHGPSVTRLRPCTRPCTAVYTVCTRPKITEVDI